MKSFWIPAGITLLVIGPAFAGAKSGYNLFNPTPKTEMRDMTADRPDTIETPKTVDAGHFQAEVSLFSYTYDAVTPQGNTITNNYSILPMTLKMGLLNWMDLELVIEPYVHNQDRDISTSTTTQASGFGDVIPRLKVNFYGNDEGRWSLGTIGFVKAPTNQNGVGNSSYEGGFIFPFSYDLSDRWALALQTQYNIVENVAGTGHDLDFVNLAGIAYGVTDNLSAFTEFFSQVSREGQSWIGRVDVGATWQVTPDFSVDGAVNIGVTQSADDVNPFVGFSWRR